MRVDSLRRSHSSVYGIRIQDSTRPLAEKLSTIRIVE
jgi:hypothetical protein